VRDLYPLDVNMNASTRVAGMPFYDAGRMFWTMAMKDYVAGTTNNQNVTAVLAATDLSQ
jgi:hypothetical protein